MKIFERILASAIAIFITVGSLSLLIATMVMKLSAPNLHILDYINIIVEPLLMVIFIMLLLQVYSWSLSKVNEMIKERFDDR